MKLKEYFTNTIDLWKETGSLALVWTLLFEVLVVGYIGFAGLYTLEVLLPTFITARLSLTKVFFFLLLGTSILAWLGAKLELDFPKESLWKSPSLWITILWGVGLLLISLIKLPLWSIPIFFGATLGMIFLFLKLLFFQDAPDPHHQDELE